METLVDTVVKPRVRTSAELLIGNPAGLEKARARHKDRAAQRRLLKALARKAETEAELKRLKMPLEN
jgi:hypothetical protein